MKTTSSWLLLLAACSLFATAKLEAALGAERTIYVSPSGNDRWSGGLAEPNGQQSDGPVATLERARLLARTIKAGADSRLVPVRVSLRAGTYYLKQTLTFAAEDSGTASVPVIWSAYRKETVTLSGGRPIVGWIRDANGSWSAPSGAGEFRQLYVNGRRAMRARGPAPDGLNPVGHPRSPKTKAGFHVADASLARWHNQGDLELGFYNSWSHMICRVESIESDPKGGAIIWMQQPGFYLATTKEGVGAQLPAYIENAFELLKEPGQWYLDRSAQKVYYLPLPGEDMQTATVIAPMLETLLLVKGNLDQPVHDLRFEDLTFAEATWLRPSRLGHADLQANFVVGMEHNFERDGHPAPIHNEVTKSPANIVLHAAKRVTLERCTLTRLGGAGLDVERGSQDNVIRNCKFHDISGSAIQIGDVLAEDHHPKDARSIVQGNHVESCVIHHAGVEYEDSVGVFVGYTDGTVLARNKIHDLPYSGISVGWGWGEEDVGGGAYKQPFFYDQPAVSRNNRVEFNDIHHVMCKRNDGGGIYTLGNQPGTLVRGNLIHDNVGSPGGIYTDEGSGFIEISSNAVYNVQIPYNQNNRAQGRDRTCREHDNSWSVPPK